ncbi:MAG: hypothetical protein L0G46_07645 [Kocuria sp.]|nr:hypothetical protein [Kocuria sp.]
MRNTHLKQPLVAAAAMLLVAGMAACTRGDDAEPVPTLEPAPTGEVSDGGGQTNPSDSGDESESQGEAVAGECNVKEGDGALPNEAPPVDGWETVGLTTAPSSSTYGPFDREGDLWSCYEHSSTGALFAATYVFAAMGQVDGFADSWVPQGEFHELVTEQEASDDSATNGTLTPAAYRYVSYTTDEAVIDVVSEYANSEGSAYLSMRIALTWSDDQWMVNVENSSDDFTPLESLDGYMKWGTNG